MTDRTTVGTMKVLGGSRGGALRAPFRSRGILWVLIVGQVLAGTAVLLAASPATAPDPVGRPLTLDTDGPVMESVNAPARIARVALVPGSDGDEAWGIGFSRARKPGYDQTTPSGQVVFVHHTRATGWQVDGPPVDRDGKVINQQLSALAVASSGEGWAVGGEGAMYHRAPGGRWILQPRRITTNTLYGVALAEDRAGVYGYAVGASLTTLRLDGDGWALDQMNGAAPAPGGTIPDLVGVAAVSRERAWAVSGSNVNSLLVFRRDGTGWARALTTRPMFDSPPAPVSGASGSTVNQFARGAAVAADRRGAWVTGMIQPVDATKMVGGDGGDRTRPFALRLDDGGQPIASYCPRQYQLSSSGIESTVDVCDKAFPYGTGDLPGLSIAPDGAVFAGGLGLFRFSGSSWERQPNIAGAIVSAAFASGEEGWVASAGDVIGGTGIAISSSSVVGHLTRHPAASVLRRWPQANESTLESVAIAPDGSDALAVGADGAILRLEPDAGWEPMRAPGDATLHAVAWAGPARAFAVGSDGAILRFDGRRWSRDAASGTLTTRPLFSLAMRDGRGYAVGDRGTILRFDGSRWSADASPTTAKLAAVAFAGHDAIAVGDTGTIVQQTGRGWRRYDDLTEELRSGQEGEAPNLLSVAGVEDGTALIGGARSVLLERMPTGRVRPSRLPDLEGAIHSLAVARVDGRLRVIASVGTGSSRYSGPFLGQANGWLFAGDAHGWRDISHARAAVTTPDVDAPVVRDAAYGIALDASGERGWIVGGFPANVFDDDGHLRSTPTSSIWRLSLDGSPQASPSEATVPLPASSGVRFAFLADTACASGLCSASLGSGSRADVLLMSALRSIAAAAEDGQVSFLVIGGDVRRNGVPDDLAAVRSLLRELPIPTFGAVGDKDLFAGIGTSGDQQGGIASSNGYYLDTFDAMAAPWGKGKVPEGVRAVTIAGQASPSDGARTHYAFDYDGVGGAVRVAVLDTSKLPLASNVDGQNPREDQTTWLQSVLTDAQTRAIPSIVVMHQPAVLPVSTAADASAITGILTAGGASGVLASHVRANQWTWSPSEASPDRVPVGVFGSGGSVLARRSDPDRGAYHAWQLVTVDPDPAKRSVTGRAPVHVDSIPILESLALDARDGRTAEGGDTLRFTALGRLPDVGGPHALGSAADQDQSRATYLTFPFPAPCGLLQDPDRDGCMPADAMAPSYRFQSEDPTIADFVRADPDHPTRPLRDDAGALVHDDHSGLLCTFEPGTTYVRIGSGTVASRVPITVTAGAGPCVEAPVAAVAQPPEVAVEGKQVPAPEDDPTGPELLRQRPPQNPAVVAIAPPLVNAAPAPPAGGGGQRQEEQEAASERSEMRALPVRTRTPASTNAGISTLAVITLIAFTASLAARRRGRHIAAPAYVHSPDPHRRHPWHP